MSIIHKSISFAATVALFALVLGFSASAQSMGKSVKMPYGFTINFCNWEMIETTGNMNIVSSFEQDENGCIKARFHLNTQNVRGVGLDTGDEYRIIDVGNQQVTDVTLCEGCTVDIDFVGTWRVIAKDGTSYIVHQVATIRIDICTNEFSVTNKQLSVDCI